jgi:NitT/TauT family transport system substrate-binding protein
MKGYFKDEGLNVVLVSFPTGKLCLDALTGGNADFATVAETPIMHASFKALPVKIVATMHRSRQNTFCVARKDQGVNVPSDLKGRTVAVPLGTNAEYALSAFMAKNNLQPSDVKFLNLLPPEMIGPITRGDVAAVAAWQPHAGRCEKALGANAVRFSFDQVYEETYNLVTSDDMTRNRKETVTRVLRALNRAVAFMADKDHQAEAIGIVAQRISMDRKELERLWPIYNFGLDLRSSLLDTMAKEGKWAVERGHQSGPIPDMHSVVSATALREVRPEAVELP